MKGLDIYLTTDPNDEPDWGEMGACCHFCGCDCFEYLSDEGHNKVLLKCDDCGHEFVFEMEEPTYEEYEPNCKECGDMDITCEHCG